MESTNYLHGKFEEDLCTDVYMDCDWSATNCRPIWFLIAHTSAVLTGAMLH